MAHVDTLNNYALSDASPRTLTPEGTYTNANTAIEGRKRFGSTLLRVHSE